MAKARDYEKEYKNYGGKPEQIKRRAARNRARSLLEKEGKVRKGDGKDVHHRDGNPLNGKKKNLLARKAEDNRSYPRTKNAHKKNKDD